MPKRKQGTTSGRRPSALYARRRKPSCFTSGIVLENGWQRTISRAPPGKSATCFRFSSAVMIAARVTSTTLQTIVTKPTVGTYFPSEDCATTRLPNRSERDASHGNRFIGYRPCGCKATMHGSRFRRRTKALLPSSSSLSCTRKRLAVATERSRDCPILHWLMLAPASAGISHNANGTRRRCEGTERRRQTSTHVSKGIRKSHQMTSPLCSESAAGGS
mmetsp:Transcript_66512/g.177097  ORF Transcript_66512/g.177097 Transcript_66512/m.177097 type:complete len:218 (+) Transcript_66512:1235-1888(+)|eukprot:7376881-Prymnesium_polylepis.2